MAVEGSVDSFCSPIPAIPSCLLPGGSVVFYAHKKLHFPAFCCQEKKEAKAQTTQRNLEFVVLGNCRVQAFGRLMGRV